MHSILVQLQYTYAPHASVDRASFYAYIQFHGTWRFVMPSKNSLDDTE